MATKVITPSPSGPAPESTLQIPARGTPEYDHWRKTGEVELPDSVKADPDPAAEAEDSNDIPDLPSGGADKNAPETAAAPEAAKPQEPERRKRGDAAKRIQELLEENRQLRQKADAKPNSSPANPDPAKAAPEKAARPTPKDVDPKTGQAKYKDWQEYEDALLAWNTEQVLSKVDERLSAKDRDSQVRSENDALVKGFQGQVDAARKEYADFDEVAFNNPEITGKIPRGSIIDLCILQTDLGAKTLYYLGKNPAKIAEILKLPPFRQSAELMKIQLQFEKPANPPAKPKSNAPAPVTELGTRAVVPGDESERAVKADDFRSYRETENAKELARRRKG
jgi:hypothetical protein